MHNEQNLVLTTGSLFSKRNLVSQRPKLSELPYGIKNTGLCKRKKDPLGFLGDILAEDTQYMEAKRQKSTGFPLRHRPGDNLKAESTGNVCTVKFRDTFRLPQSTQDKDSARDFSLLPNDVLQKILSLLKLPAIHAAGSTCRSWREAARPAKQALELRCYGRAYKHNKSKIRKSINHEKALTCFLRAAQGGCLAAATDAGVLLWEKGKKEEAVKWYIQAAEGGDPTGACNLGLAFLSGDGVHKDPPSGVRWLTTAAKASNARAAYQLGLCCQHGNGTPRDMSAAAEWYKQSAQS
ncbi:hypothetical protein CYMTET_9241, partial [Cymbomonas tetramitiformis]